MSHSHQKGGNPNINKKQKLISRENIKVSNIKLPNLKIEVNISADVKIKYATMHNLPLPWPALTSLYYFDNIVENVQISQWEQG